MKPDFKFDENVRDISRNADSPSCKFLEYIIPKSKKAASYLNNNLIATSNSVILLSSNIGRLFTFIVP